jgi:hypothetical protein
MPVPDTLRHAASAASILVLALLASPQGCGGSTVVDEGRPGDGGGPSDAGAFDSGGDVYSCPACLPPANCPYGLLVDANGCTECRCAPPPDGGGSPCSASAPCGVGFQCGYPTKNACSAAGTCFVDPGVHCELFSPGCACDGTTVNIGCTGLPDGYAPAPLVHTGECTDAGPSEDGGPGVDGGKACARDADCTPGICGFPTANACTATGTCFPAPGVTCAAYVAGCACDGSMVNIACNGLPSGYAPRPLRHAGMCAADGG